MGTPLRPIRKIPKADTGAKTPSMANQVVAVVGKVAIAPVLRKGMILPPSRRNLWIFVPTVQERRTLCSVGVL